MLHYPLLLNIKLTDFTHSSRIRLEVPQMDADALNKDEQTALARNGLFGRSTSIAVTSTE
jgi:hypothetical protein